MKKKNLHLLFVILLLAARPGLTFSRNTIQADNKEKVVLITDRPLYVTGEKVQFSAIVFTSDQAGADMESQILYCEIITPDGNKISSDKFLIVNSSAAGCLPVPGEVLTGTYYLKAYTKQMRNSGPESYGYKQIMIVNPGRNEVLSGKNSENANNENWIEATDAKLADMLSVSVDKNEYLPGDSVRLSLQTTKAYSAAIKSLSLSVAPETAVSSPMLVSISKKQQKVVTDFYPETRGLSLTGKLTAGPSRIPVKEKRVNLSIIGEGRDFMAVRTDSLGRFFFALPDYTGSRDLFLCAEKMPLPDLKIWVDNDFCALPVNLPSPVFSLSAKERQMALNMALNVQINSHFNPDTLDETETTKIENRAFYGDPTTVLYLDQYVQLPTLEEYFNELPGLVKVRKRMGEKYFKVIGNYDLSFYDPLVMVDWVAVDEPERILAVPPQNISRIEIVNQTYVKGGQTYGGIISIISKKGDFAGIDLPTTGIFINFRFLAENQCIENPDHHSPHHPDARNTVVWKPDIPVPKSESEKFVFLAPGTPGQYTISFEGVTTGGDRFSITRGFTVKN